MKTRSGREIVCFVAREGKAHGVGRYLGAEADADDPDWEESRVNACRWIPVPDKRAHALDWLARNYPEARLVPIVRPFDRAPELVKTIEEIRSALAVPEGVDVLAWIRLSRPTTEESERTWPAMLLREILRMSIAERQARTERDAALKQATEWCAKVSSWENDDDFYAIRGLRMAREAGWSVASHNDYRQGGQPHTFWLFTKGDLVAKGEGPSDRDALERALAEIERLTRKRTGNERNGEVDGQSGT